jgi:NADH-quinone oxidoreductase subunit H
MLIVSMVGTVLFLGGWSGPGPAVLGPIWFLGKSYCIIFMMMWFRWTFPRLRFDQLMTFAWAIMIPLSIVNLIATAVVLKVV